MSKSALRFSPWRFAVGAALILTACARSAEDPAPAPPALPEPQAAAAHAAPHWGYGAEHGPAEWAALSPDFGACASGARQSPIDLAGAAAESSAGASVAELQSIPGARGAEVVNNGHTVQVNYAGAGSLTIDGETFPLAQYHFHSPSENTVDGKHYPMEMHLVHQSAGGQLAVLGVFIEEGAKNAAFAPVWSNLPREKGSEVHLERLAVSVDDLLPEERVAWSFDGSLTTPPCSEGVKWLVLKEPVELSGQQIAAFRAVVDGNSRPTQPLNGRPVTTARVERRAAS